MKISIPSKATLKKIFFYTLLGATTGIAYAGLFGPVSIFALSVAQVATAAAYGLAFAAALFTTIKTALWGIRRIGILDKILVQAVEKNASVRYINFLLWAGADVNATAQTFNPQSSHMAKTFRNFNISLLNAVIDNSRSPILFIAIRNNNIDILNVFLASPDIQINSLSTTGETALIYAITYKNVAAINALLAKPDIEILNIIDMDGKNALELADQLPSPHRDAIFPLVRKAADEELCRFTTHASSSLAAVLGISEAIDGPINAILSYAYPDEERWSPLFQQKRSKNIMERQANSAAPQFTPASLPEGPQRPEEAQEVMPPTSSTTTAARIGQ